MSNTVRSPLKRVGGKSASAQRIVAAFPPDAAYDTYCEPCCGALHVLFAKPPVQHREVLNDADDLLVNFWMQMIDHADVMQEQLAQLPYSRAVYYLYYRSLFDGTPLTDLEKAVRWFYVLRSTGTGWMRRSPVGWNNLDANARAYRSALDLFHAVQERLRDVLLDNRDVLSTIDRYDSPCTLFYIDPPYIGTERYYEASKHGFPHEALAERLNHVQGYVALSYYPHPALDDLYPVSTWRRQTWTQPKTSQIQSSATMDTATEMLLCNYPEPARSLWDEEQDGAA